MAVSKVIRYLTRIADRVEGKVPKPVELDVVGRLSGLAELIGAARKRLAACDEADARAEAKQGDGDGRGAALNRDTDPGPV